MSSRAKDLIVPVGLPMLLAVVFFALQAGEGQRIVSLMAYLAVAVPIQTILVRRSFAQDRQLEALEATPSRMDREVAITRHRELSRFDSNVAGPMVAIGCGGLLIVALGGITLLTLAPLPLRALVVLALHTMGVYGFLENRAAKKKMAYLRKQAAPTLEEVVASGVPPVLYLRSFQDDDETQRREEDYVGEEEEIAAALSSLGPLIAIGEPGEVLPDLGAARGQFGDGEWQAAIQQFMNESVLTVIRAGSTPGLLWEIRQAVERLDPRALIFLITVGHDNYERFRRIAGPELPQGLPDIDPAELSEPDTARHSTDRRAMLKSLRGIVYFDADWTPRFKAISTRAIPIHSRLITLGLHRALEPVYENLGKAWGPRHRSPFLGVDWMRPGG